ncbi:Slit 2 protein [Branchiostoma belcheri]|nr:Slit 2 protein [Branchiostoma belcheri]
MEYAGEDQLSVKGRVTECSSIIAKLLKTKTDPDLQIALRHVASFNAINEGKLKKANRLLREIEAFLPETKNEAEHRLQWYPLKSLAKLREGRYDMGIVFAKEALPLVDTVAPGCMTAWMLINHAWFLTEIAAGQDDEGDRQFLLRKAEKDYQDAIDHADNEHPEQMHYFQLRVPQFAKIGLAFLYLGCRELVDSSRLEISQDVSLDNIRKAKSLIAALDKEEMVCSVSTFLLKMAKACLYYRLGSYQVAYDLAKEGKAFATKQSLGVPQCTVMNTTVDCSDKGFIQVPDTIPADTTRLDLSSNNIQQLDDFSFSTLPLLTSLDLSSNSLVTIQPAAFYNLSKLRELSLSRNNLSALPSTDIPTAEVTGCSFSL